MAPTELPDWTPSPAAVARVGLGVVVFLAGAHKVLAPAAWVPYLAPVFADRWPVSLTATMVAFGVSELPFGVALVADRYVAASAAVVAVSMVGTVANLAILVVQTGSGADVLVRDLAVLFLATAVALRAVDRE